jgi:hypothetical protein
MFGEYSPWIGLAIAAVICFGVIWVAVRTP